MGDAIRPPLRVLPNPPSKKERRKEQRQLGRARRGAAGRRMKNGGKVKSKKKSYRGAGCEIRG